ncbi:hypothetical protein C8A03DRAFT_37192 [Achaetomium macrosporum]|uniref:Copper acquisition factor BIM1-like domain-containing protein n=1 Tax=Achaetomium macrosporum TaxID=79813 RepID=A0AAN7H8C1_9PEZI|nr:hypothetical protein C8A03DRAFT_37192 [Achaetomium macrosporum]
MAFATLLLLAAASLAQAHFSIEYPTWRADTLNNESYSQWTNPCGGVPGNLTTPSQRTPWPLTGGSLKLDLHHPWTYVFVNLGLGADVSNFNYTLTNPFWNETGNGTLCVSRLGLPTDLPISDGSPASLQVVTVGEDGNALYNCADIVFRANATALSGDDCVTSEGVSFAPVVAGQGQTTNGTGPGSGSDTQGNAGSVTGVTVSALTSVVALAMVFVFGMSL